MADEVKSVGRCDAFASIVKPKVALSRAEKLPVLAHFSCVAFSHLGPSLPVRDLALTHLPVTCAQGTYAAGEPHLFFRCRPRASGTCSDGDI